MAAWVEAGPDRWVWDDDPDHHVLTVVGGMYVEVHEATVHLYRPVGVEPLVANPGGGWLMGDQLMYVRSVPVDAAARDVWEAAAAAVT